MQNRINFICMLNLLKLYRLDAFIIYTGSYVFGSLIVSHEISIIAIAYAVLVSSLPVNFVYSLNSINDWNIDKINKPHRPLPSGKISLPVAKRYVIFLLIISLVAGGLFESIYSKLLYFVIIIIGILYSNNIYPFKKNKYLSVLCTSTLLIIPMLIAALRTGNALSIDVLSLTVFIFLFLLITIPLKDIEDVKGDTMNASQNWYAVLNDRLMYTSALLNFLLIFIAILLLPQTPLKSLTIIFFFLQFLITLVNLLKKELIKTLYRQKMIATIIYMFMIWIYQNL